jgi:CubicO group peptidase (beta-lactamase class C family)
MSVLPLSMGDPAFEFLVNGCGFGLGFAVIMNTTNAAGPRSQGSYGWFGYNSTNFWIDPKEQLIGIIMSPFEPPPPYPAVREFQVLMYQSIID